MALSFKEAFGPTAELYRTNDIGNMFAVRSGPAQSSAYGEGETFFNRADGPSTWQFDPNTGKFTNSADPTKTVTASDLGFGGVAGQNVPFALTKLAAESGSLRDPWAQEAISSHPGWGTDQVIGALRNDAPEMIRQGAPSSLDNFMGTAIPATVIATMTAGAGGMFDAGGSLANLAGNGAAAGEGLAVGGGQAGGTGLTAGGGITGATTTGGGITGATAGGSLGVTGTAAGAIDPTVASVMAGTGKSAADAAKLVAIAQSSTSGGADAVRATLTSMGVPSGVIDTLVKIVPAAAGAIVASRGGGGAKEAGTTTTTSAQAPWAPMQPYLTDIAGKAQANYNNALTMSPQQQGLLSQAQGIASGQMNDPRMAGLRDQATDVFMGRSNAFSPVGQVTAQQVDPFGFQSQNAPAINVQNAFGSMGGTNPTQAYQSLLSGSVTNPYLQNIAQDNFTMANRNLLENVMPNIGSGATAAGQYGGSRQGIAQGLAMSRMNQDVTAANNNMFGNAYQQAQGNMLSAAGQLGGFGMSAETNNASNTLNNNQFNSSLSSGIAQNNANRTLQADTQNAANTLTGNNQRLGQMGAAVDWYNTSNNMQNTGIKNALDLANYGNTYQNDALKNYAGIVAPLGGMGGTGSSSTPYYTNPTNNVLGGALAGSQIFKNIFA